MYVPVHSSHICLLPVLTGSLNWLGENNNSKKQVVHTSATKKQIYECFIEQLLRTFEVLVYLGFIVMSVIVTLQVRCVTMSM